MDDYSVVDAVAGRGLGRQGTDLLAEVRAGRTRWGVGMYALERRGLVLHVGRCRWVPRRAWYVDAGDGTPLLDGEGGPVEVGRDYVERDGLLYPR
jgi:hypothetical protein